MLGNVSNINIMDESLPIDEEMNVEKMKNDLMSLLWIEDISKEKADEHPFLRYVERVNKEYQHEGIGNDRQQGTVQ